MDPLTAALDVIGLPDLSNPANALVQTKQRALVSAYNEVYAADRDFDILAVERLVVAPLWNVETKKLSRTFAIAGKLDLCIEHQNHYVVVDHKTTGDSIEDPDGLYYKQLVVEGQYLHYKAIEESNGRALDHVLVNVSRKPSIEPRQLQAKYAADIFDRRTYFGTPVSNEAAVHAHATGRENLELYEARLFHDAAFERPQWYFARRPLHYNYKIDLYEYMADLWADAVAIRKEKLEARHTKSSKACMAFGTPCQFLGICSGYDREDSDRWERVRNVHEELVGLPGESRAYLTNSRLQMFKLCRRKHDFLYNQGIRRQESSEALAYGILWHEALKKYYETMQQNQQEERKEQDESVTATV